MRRPAIHQLQRAFAALLWVLASFAFMTRQQDMSMPMSGMPMGAATSQAAPLMETTELETAQMDADTEHVGHPSAQPQAAHPHHQTKTHNANAPPAPAHDNHAGHCPFCFTAAFALEAFSVDFLALHLAQTAYQLTHTPAAPQVLLNHKHARAPPLLG